jgi:hypothetical protein
MIEDTRRVLELLAQGKVTVDEAHQLLHALTDQPRSETAGKSEATPFKPRFIRIHVHKPAKDGREAKDVNIRVPMAVVRGGMRLGMIIPGWQDRASARMRERGVDIDLAKIDPAMIESILSEMGEMNIDVNGTGEQVRITVE